MDGVEIQSELCIVLNVIDSSSQASLTPVSKTSRRTGSSSPAANREVTPTTADTRKFKQCQLRFPSGGKSSSPDESGKSSSSSQPSPHRPTSNTDSVTPPPECNNGGKTTTPPPPRSSPSVHNTAVTPTDPKPRLTKQQREELKAEKEKIKAEMKAKKEEERQKKEQEKQLREQERREKQLKRELESKERRERREREELEKKQRRECEELERKRRREQKEAEKRKREEEKQKKLEEKKRLEHKKELIKEEKLRKETLARQKFRGYFGIVEKPAIKKDCTPCDTLLTPFSVKDNMFLAKAPRDGLRDTAEFDQLLEQQDPANVASSYIETLKVGRSRRRNQHKQPQCEVDSEDGSSTPSDSTPALPKFKLLQFAENNRPAYFGTWRKPQGAINPRNPLKKDEGLLDYEVDSDEEWEEEEPGESLSNSEGEDKEGEGDCEDSDEDDGFFVPHGYLSDDEGDSDGSRDIPAPGEDRQDSKRKKQLAKAWEAEYARKCQPLKPRIIGCLWLSTQPVSGQERTLSKEDSFLLQFAAVPLVPLPLPMPTITKGETSADKREGIESSSKEHLKVKQPVPEEAMPDLIRLIHKSSMGVNKIIKTFRTHWGAKISMNSPDPVPPPQDKQVDSTPKSTNPAQLDEYANASGISKRQLEKKIQAIARKEVRVPLGRPVWYVQESVMKQYELSQENLTPLVPDIGSPLLSPKLPDQQPACKTPKTANQVSRGLKRKNGVVGKSLLQFLSKPALAPSPKQIKLDVPSESMQAKLLSKCSPPSGDDDVIILDPPHTSPAPPAESAVIMPPAKRLHLEEQELPPNIHNEQDEQDILHTKANQELVPT